MVEGLGLTLRGRRERVAVGSGKDEGGGMHKSSGIAAGTHSGSSGGEVNTEAVGWQQSFPLCPSLLLLPTQCD